MFVELFVHSFGRWSINIWLLVEGEGLRAALAPFGVVVRDLGSFGMDGRVRVALPRPHELDRVLSAFAAVAGAR